VVYVARVQVRRVMSISIDVGSRVPAHATSMGRVLLAWAGTDLVDQVIGAGLERLARKTVTDPVTFRNSLHDVRQRGYALVESELEDGLLSASVPVRDPNGDVVAAMAYSTTLGRRTHQQVVDEVVPVMFEVAAAIERDLGLLRESRPKIAPSARDGFF
jgi:IclR family pca regulon transcriptional regulator